MKQKNTFNTFYSRIVLFSGIALLFSVTTNHAQSWTFAGAGGSANAENGKAICADAAGNVYVTGQFTNTVDFDLGAGTANLVSNGANDIFIASYTSTGAYRWAVRAGGTGADNNSPNGGICTDGVSVYVTGSYNGAATLFGGISLTPNGGTGTDAFVAKLNCTTGAFTWAVSMGGTGNVDTGVALCLDPSGNPYLLGSFNSTISGACGNVSLGGSDIFVSKLNPANGACVWMASGGSATNDGTLGGGICYHPGTASLVVASTTNTGSATFGGFNVTSVGGIDMCVLELNSTTGAWLGAVGSGSATTDDAIACAYDPITTNVMVCGAFTNNMTLPGGINLTASSAGIQDAWWGSYSVASNGFVWARSAVGTGLDRANGIAVDGGGSVLITGQYVTNPTTFGALSLTNTNSGAFDDMFVVGYGAASGTALWATKNTYTGGGQTSLTAGRAIAFAGTNNFWTTGQNTVNSTFNVALPSNGFADFFVAKLNAPPPPCIDPTIPSVTATTPICAGGSSTLTITGTLNSATEWHIYSGSCGGTLVGTTSGATFMVSPGSTTTYFVRGEGGCVTPGLCGSTTVTVNTAPATPEAISGTTTICSGTSNTYSVTAVPGATSYTWTLPVGWTGTSTTNSITTTAGATGGNISVTANNLCGSSGSSSQSITVNSAPATPGAISGTTIVCSGSSNTYSVTAVPGATSYTWTLPGGWTGTSTTNSITTTAGATNGNIMVTASNTCGTSGSSSQLIIVPSAIVLNIASQTNETCGLLNAAVSVNSATGGSGGYTYNWTPGTPTGDGTTSITGIGVGIWTCTVTDATSCTATVSTTITNTGSLDNASFNYSAASYCATDADPTPTITGLPGGLFSSTAGLSINASTGVIDVSVSTPATYTVTYLTAGPCPNSTMVSVTILGLDNAGFNYSAASYCTNAADPTPTITGLAGGTFSSTAGLSINASTGVIDVSASTPDTYTVTYTTSGPCPNSSNVSVTINALDNAGFNYSAASYCTNAADPTPTITGLSGGTFSSTTGLSINAGTGTIDVSTSTPGAYTVTYTTVGPCPNSSNVSVTFQATILASNTDFTAIVGLGKTYYEAATCNLIAKIIPNGGGTSVAGNILAKVTVDPTVQVAGSQPYLQRHYDIEPATNAANATARVTLYFTQTEFNDFNSHPNSSLDLPIGPNDGTGKSNLKITQLHGTGTSLNNYNGTSEIIDPVDSDIIWNTDSNFWEVSFNVIGFSGFYVSTSSLPLPVTLISFSGKSTEKGNLLNWKTSSETNFSHFEIERSVNSNLFESIGKVKGKNGEIYEFLDGTNSKKLNYYRLKMIDLNGSFKYSRIVFIQNEKEENMVGHFYPNPSQGKSFIEITTLEKGNWSISTFDLTGKLIKSETRILQKGLNKIEIEKLNIGVNFVRFENSTISEIRKVILD